MEMEYRNLMMEIGEGKYTYLGAGSARRVYDLENGYVIKIAKNQKGIAQNQVEYKISKQDDSGLFARVIKTSPNYRYVIMEKAMKIYDFSEVLNNLGYESERQFRSSILVRELSREYDLAKADLMKKSSWGYIGDKIVLIDYGFTVLVRAKYY